MFICIKVSQCKWIPRPRYAAISHPSAGTLSLCILDVCAFAGLLLCEEVKPLSDGVYILVRKTKTKAKKTQTNKKNQPQQQPVKTYINYW